ncbi:MAG: hypothetical protein JWL84_442 [Rhodospirillales bacterium]|jgi:hypothetical protein|nr:hypothetical protein [Rhodospirillales bacterium]
MALVKRFLAAQQRRLVNWDQRRRHHPALPALDPRDRDLVAALQREGSALSSIGALGLPGTEAMLAAADRLAASTLGRTPGKGGFNIQPSAAELDANPEIIAWGLDERLLAIAANYIGLPVDYRGVVLRRDIAGGTSTETRLWHRDDEDVRILKIIVYLNDVGPDGGPYEFVAKHDGPAPWRLPPRLGRIEDPEMARWAARERWRSCTGTRGTAVFSDTCSVLHRGLIGTAADRLTLFFCYNSKQPVHPEWCEPLFDRTTFLSRREALSPAQQAAIAP